MDLYMCMWTIGVGAEQKLKRCTVHSCMNYFLFFFAQMKYNFRMLYVIKYFFLEKIDGDFPVSLNIMNNVKIQYFTTIFC